MQADALRKKNLIWVSAAAAMAIKDEEDESGDSYSFMELPGGGYMIALSDGMGSGSEAGGKPHGDRTAGEVLGTGIQERDRAKPDKLRPCYGKRQRDIRHAGYLLYRPVYGQGGIYKNGAAATYVIRDGTAKAIKSSSLPMGDAEIF